MSDAHPLGWGVLAPTARVAQLAVLPAMAATPTARLVAVASESGGCGDGLCRAYRSYAALVDDPEVEAVYIPLPNGLHRMWTERSAAAGKHVLCEKPLAPTAADAQAMATACAAAGVILLEAYMTPFHSRAAAVDALVRSGRLGDLRFGRAAFTGVLQRPGDHRWQPAQGGGALLDLGIYCVSPFLAAAGRAPVRVEASAVMAAGGVDASFSGWLDFGGGFSAAIECSFEAPERQLLEIVGTDASVVFDRAYTPGPHDVAFALRHRDGRLEEIVAGGNDPYRAMIEHFAAVVRGETRSRRPPAESVALLAVVDRLGNAARAPQHAHP